ncbi:MAG: hypothetical protein NXY57DRAFT_675520 [Lentinula lateritia]|nr:MAG: hypothetical protein NXY57DRAFT_675520 [Lentinula lateritia]
MYGIRRSVLDSSAQGTGKSLQGEPVASVLVTSPITQNNEVLSKSQLSFFSSPIPIIVLAVAASRTSLIPEQSSSEQGLQRPVKSRQSPKYRIRSLIRLPARISSSIRGIIRSRSGALTIYGYTNTTTFTANSNSTTLLHWLASTAGSDDASGTLWIHDNFGMYLVNFNNLSFGCGVQAIALSQDGRQVGSMGVGFMGIRIHCMRTRNAGLLEEVQRRRYRFTMV